MNDATRLIGDLRGYDSEREWFEFKVNWFQPYALGEYISALANSAAYLGRKYAYFVWGINDETHAIEGTSFNPNCNVKNEPLKHFLARQLSPENNFCFEELVIDENVASTSYQRKDRSRRAYHHATLWTRDV